MLAQALDPTCGAHPSFICREVLERTSSTWLASLADFLFARPLAILLVIGLAWVVSWAARRAIGRFVAAMVGDETAGRKLKRHLRGSKVAAVIPSSVLNTGVVSLRASARAETLGVVLRSVASSVIWAIAGITILGELLGINLAPLIAGAGLAGVALGFGAQSLVKDFLAGIFILIEDQYGVGDIVDVGDASGTVEAVTLRTTRIRDVNGTVWHVPNGQILRVGNKSQQWARALLDVPVAYGTDIGRAESIIKGVADGVWQDRAWLGQVLEEPEVWGIEELGPDGMKIRLVVKTLPARQFAVMRELRGRLSGALSDAGLEMTPSAQHTIRVVSDPAPPTGAKVAAKKAKATPSPPRRSTPRKQG